MSERQRRIIMPELPSPEEMKASALRWYERVSPTFIDQWPADLAALSMPTALVEWPHEITEEFYERDPGVAAAVARQIDAACSWTNFSFIRLNSRSPKDACYPDLPLTNAGRHALLWIATSERCLDDLGSFRWAEKPAFVCVRERAHFDCDYEFRCFVKDRKLIAVTQYYYDKPIGWLQEAADRKRIRKAIDDWFSTVLLPRLHVDTVVFDVVKDYRDNWLLIEINPYGLSNPCVLESYDGVENFSGDIAYTPEQSS